MEIPLKMDTALGVRGIYRVCVAEDLDIRSFLPGIRARSLRRYDDGVYGPELTNGPFQPGQRYYIYSNNQKVTDRLLMGLMERQAETAKGRRAPSFIRGSQSTR